MTLKEQVEKLNATRYTLVLTGAEVVSLAGIVAEADQYNPARVSLAEKVAEVRAQSMRDREEAYRQ